MADCSTARGNTGLQACKPNYGMIDFIVFVPSGHFFADEATALDVLNWETLINEDPAVRAFPFPKFMETTDNSEEDVVFTGQEGKTEDIRDGREMYEFMLENMNTYNFRQLRTHNSKAPYSAYVFTSNGYLKANSSDGTKVEARPIQSFKIKKLRAQTTDNVQRAMMSITFASTDTYHDLGVDLKPTWIPQTELIGIKDVKLVVSEITTTSLTVNVTGFSDGIGVEGLVSGDFVFTKAGVDVVVTATEVGDGEYSLAYPTATGAHILDLKNQPAMTTKFYESVASVAVSVA